MLTDELCHPTFSLPPKHPEELTDRNINFRQAGLRFYHKLWYNFFSLLSSLLYRADVAVFVRSAEMVSLSSRAIDFQGNVIPQISLHLRYIYTNFQRGAPNGILIACAVAFLQFRERISEIDGVFPLLL